MEQARIKYCPICGTKATDNKCPYHGIFYEGPRLRVCLNGHVMEVLKEGK